MHAEARSGSWGHFTAERRWSLKFEISQIVQTIIIVAGIAVAYGKLDERVTRNDRDHTSLAVTVGELREELVNLRIEISAFRAARRGGATR